MQKRITKEEGIRMLEEYSTPVHVIRHCIAVTDTAVNIAEAVNRAGHNLDIQLVTGAAIIHDIARVSEHHELAGAEYAEKIGLHQEADIIRRHMRYPKFNDIENINEADVVCLSDRVVKEDRYVGIDERIEYIVNKARSGGKGDDVIREIYAKKEETKEFIRDIERITGRDFDDICSLKG